MRWVVLAFASSAVLASPAAFAALPVAPQAPGDLPAAEPPVLPAARLKTQEPLRFDRSLGSLERNRVINLLERRQLEAGTLLRRTHIPALEQACRSGALSPDECAAGVRLRGRSGLPIIQHEAPDTVQKQALRDRLDRERKAAADAAHRREQVKRLRFRNFGGLCIYDWESWGLSSTGVRSVKVIDCGITSEIATDCKNLRISELIGGKWSEWQIPSGDRERMFIESANTLGAT